MEIVCNRTRTKVAAAAEVAVKERKSQSTEARYQVLQKKLSEEVEKRRYSEKVCEDLRENVERAKCVTVDLLKGLEACRTAYDPESLRVDELTATAKKKEQEYDTEFAKRSKKLADYEVARILDSELIEKLKARCSELRSQRSQAEEQLCEMETRLTEAEGKNRQLSEQARDALTAMVNRCLRGCVLWQIETHNWLWLRELEYRAAELIAGSGRRQRRLAKKLNAFLSRSRDAVVNLELELVGVLKRLGLDGKLEGAATADSAGLGPVRSSHKSG